MSTKLNNKQASSAAGKGGVIRAEATIDNMPEMTESCARDLTNQINTASEDLAGMLQRARDGKAWAALGYETWKAYVAAEIKLSKSRVYQLLDHAEMRQELEKSTLVDSSALTERGSRALKKTERSKRPAVLANAVKKAGGEQPTARQIEEAAEEATPTDAAETPPAPANGIVDQAARHWDMAKKHLDKIAKEDASRERVLREVIAYAQGKLEGQE